MLQQVLCFETLFCRTVTNDTLCPTISVVKEKNNVPVLGMFFVIGDPTSPYLGRKIMWKKTHFSTAIDEMLCSAGLPARR